MANQPHQSADEISQAALSAWLEQLSTLTPDMVLLLKQAWEEGRKYPTTEVAEHADRGTRLLQYNELMNKRYAILSTPGDLNHEDEEEIRSLDEQMNQLDIKAHVEGTDMAKAYRIIAASAKILEEEASS